LDLKLLTSLFRFTLRLYETGPFGALVKRCIMPTSEDLSSDDKLQEYIKNNCGPVYHPIATASMLPREDGGVVDTSLRVYGTANLRVVSRRSLCSKLTRSSRIDQVDASIIPLVSCSRQSCEHNYINPFRSNSLAIRNLLSTQLQRRSVT
jgi:hypothetical protein